MAKAIEGAALLAGAVGMGVAAFLNPALLASPFFDKAWASLALGGIAMEAGAIASALTSNRGMNITTRQPAANRQIIYGTQRVGGILIYPSTTGSHHDQYNKVIVLAGHECDSIVNLYLDGRQVHWQTGSVDNHTRNGNNFGGSADSNTYTGPNGQQYNFGGLVYAQAFYGDQNASNGFSTGLAANDPTWTTTAQGTPYAGGCCYIYLKVEDSATMFPGEPEIRVTINGKNDIWDPRTQSRGFTTNWALICADILTDTAFGLGDDSVNQAQLIAAANVCDEQIALAAGGTESRYAANHHYDTSVSPGDALAAIMPAGGGRLSRINGEWYLWPAYWQGPSFTFDANAITGTMTWEPYRSLNERFNRVSGTYTAPQFPYNILGNLYDANGFDPATGEIQNNFNYAFQPTNFPQYACDVAHGYAADQYLADDGGEPFEKELTLNTVLSVSQAQRLAKIELLRNRQQGSGVFPMSLAAWSMQPTDVMQFTDPLSEWSNKILEIYGVDFNIADDENGAPSVRCSMKVQETDPSIYEWSEDAEEENIYGAPASSMQAPYTPAAPTEMSLTSSAETALRGADGIVRPRVMVQWNTPLDILVKQIQIQYQSTAAGSAWVDSGVADVGSNSAYVDGVVAGNSYNFRIRSVRASGATSGWDEVDGYTVSLTLSTVTSIGLNPNSPYNVSNTATVDSISESGAATIRVYGPGGDGSSYTRLTGAGTSTMTPAHITGEAFTTFYNVIYDTTALSYKAFTDYNDTLADQYIWVGSVVTCASTYTGASTGTGSTGGGSAGGGGGVPGGSGGRNQDVL